MGLSGYFCERPIEGSTLRKHVKITRNLSLLDRIGHPFKKSQLGNLMVFSVHHYHVEVALDPDLG
jgi:hypothetical protein